MMRSKYIYLTTAQSAIAPSWNNTLAVPFEANMTKPLLFSLIILGIPYYFRKKRRVKSPLD